MKNTVIDLIDNYEAHIDYLKEEKISYIGEMNCEELALDHCFLDKIDIEIGAYQKVINDLRKLG